MKKFFGLLILLLMIAPNCFAMTFSQPVEIGGIYESIIRNPIGAYFVEKSNENNGTINKNSSVHYDNGVARWGEGKWSIYCHYGNGQIKFGDKNISNTIKSDGISISIQKIENNAGKIIYLLKSEFSSHATHNSVYEIIGKMDNGKWVKYFSADGSFNRLLEENAYLPHPSNLICKNDTIIIEFSNNHEKKNYEMRYKWDESAQWFGVEQVVY